MLVEWGYGVSTRLLVEGCDRAGYTHYMKIGLVSEAINQDSLRYVFGGLQQALAQRHEVVYLPYECLVASPQKQNELYEEFLLGCDVITCGVYNRVNDKVLQVRERITKRTPLVIFLLGIMSRSAMNLERIARHLRSIDVLVGNCTGDCEIAEKFFKNAKIRLLPFAFDEPTFYPLDGAQKQAIKTEMGFNKDARILLYVGRLTLEKNLHTLLRVFSILQHLVPDLHLVVVGETGDSPFTQLGVFPLNIGSTLIKLVSKLGLITEQTHFFGRKSPAQLRSIYNIADILVNFTIHHDENFGYAQVEAMACGTPVVGTSWGGLKDTIKHGETGYQVSTIVTDAGVKVNWWEAINRIACLLNDGARLRRLQEKCRAHALKNFSQARYAASLESILNDCVKASKNGCEPLRVTNFANQFWRQCAFRPLSPPPYQRSAQSFRLYRELISPFTGTTEAMISADEALAPQQILILAAPIQINKSGVINIDDPVYPFELGVPHENRELCELIFDIMREEPVIKIERLQYLLRLQREDSLHGSLKWLLNAGLLLRSKPMDIFIDPQMIGRQMSDTLFSVKIIDHMTDLIMIK
jgi:glycosyltransferase involved in cell wall biosynthesis